MTQKGTRLTSRKGKREDACELASLILQHHRNDAGEPEDISVEELLPGEDSRKVCEEIRGHGLWCRSSSQVRGLMVKLVHDLYSHAMVRIQTKIGSVNYACGWITAVCCIPIDLEVVVGRCETVPYIK